MLLLWNRVQDNRDWNSDIQSPPFEMKMFFKNTTASSNPQCFKCILKWGNLFLPMECIILRELLLQITGLPVAPPPPDPGSEKEVGENSLHWQFPSFMLWEESMSGRQWKEKKKKKINFLYSRSKSRVSVHSVLNWRILTFRIFRIFIRRNKYY